jgi:hypothetical protein
MKLLKQEKFFDKKIPARPLNAWRFGGSARLFVDANNGKIEKNRWKTQKKLANARAVW